MTKIHGVYDNENDDDNEDDGGDVGSQEHHHRSVEERTRHRRLQCVQARRVARHSGPTGPLGPPSVAVLLLVPQLHLLRRGLEEILV